jgi:hypothetical protein
MKGDCEEMMWLQGEMQVRAQCVRVGGVGRGFFYCLRLRSASCQGSVSTAQARGPAAGHPCTCVREHTHVHT